MKMDNQKLLLIFFFVLITVVTSIMKNSVAVGYEYSIYESLSIPIFLLFFPMIYTIKNVLAKQKQGSNFLIFNLILFLMTGLIILFIPNIKGYIFYPMGDVSTHMGNIIDTIYQNKVPDGLIYPILHILIVLLYYISNIDYYKIMIFFGPIYSIISMIYLYVLARYIFYDSNKAIMTVFIGFFSLSIVKPSPSVIASLYILIVLFIFLRTITKCCAENKILMIIFVIVYPFFHPLVNIMLIASIMISGTSYKVMYNKMKESSIFYTMSLISLIVLVLWIWKNFWFWDNHIIRLIRWFIYETGDKGRYQDVMYIANEYSIDYINIIMRLYAQNIFYIIFSFLAIYLIIKKKRFGTANDSGEKMFLLFGWIFVNVLVGLATFFLPSSGSPDRMVYYAGIVAPIFVTYLFVELKKFARYTISIVLAILIMNGALVIHQSDYIQLPNLQVTKMEILGSKWLIDYKEEDLKIKSNHQRLYRIADLLKGGLYTNNHNLNELRNTDYGTLPLNHFGYDIYNRMGDKYEKDNYLIIEKYDEVLYFKLYPNSIKFNKIDFDKLNFDTTIYKIYNNGEFNVQLVKGTNTTKEINDEYD